MRILVTPSRLPVKTVEEDPCVPEVLYSYNESTGKYHKSTCVYASAAFAQKTLAELVAIGASPCAICVS